MRGRSLSLSSSPDKPTDPADKEQGADQFRQVNRRGGYGPRLLRVIEYARKGYTLQAGEGLLLVEEIDRLSSLLSEVTQ